MAGCATPRPAVPLVAHNTVTVPSSAGVYKVGNPYQIDNVWYYPHEQPDYDETGIASWYGPTFYGKATANGEMYDGNALTAAHRTLPMPVNVRVTNLENGKSIVVRVNDRGPYARGRIIDLSRHAAELLDVVQTGTARVRVTYLSRADLENGQPPPSVTPPEIASALPAAPTAKIDTAALNTLPNAADRAAGPGKALACGGAGSADPGGGRQSAHRTGDQDSRFPSPRVSMSRSAPFPSSTMPRHCSTSWAATFGYLPFNAMARPSIECEPARSIRSKMPMRRWRA